MKVDFNCNKTLSMSLKKREGGAFVSQAVVEEDVKVGSSRYLKLDSLKNTYYITYY